MHQTASNRLTERLINACSASRVHVAACMARVARLARLGSLSFPGQTRYLQIDAFCGNSVGKVGRKFNSVFHA